MKTIPYDSLIKVDHSLDPKCCFCTEGLLRLQFGPLVRRVNPYRHDDKPFRGSLKIGLSAYQIANPSPYYDRFLYHGLETHHVDHLDNTMSRRSWKLFAVSHETGFYPIHLMLRFKDEICLTAWALGGYLTEVFEPADSMAHFWKS